MARTKYIVVKWTSLETMIVFDEMIQHAEMARMIDKEVVSAGFIALNSFNGTEYGPAHVFPYGESVSLKLKSRPEDKKLADRLFGIDND